MRSRKIDAIILPGGAVAVRQLRAAGIGLPILTGSSMDGTYWLASAPGLTDFYSATQCAVDDDRARPFGT
jgi:branched-chain amino acid transport system substrate-binding protein